VDSGSSFKKVVALFSAAFFLGERDFFFVDMLAGFATSEHPAGTVVESGFTLSAL
jgi:hypothetical protein